MLYVSPEPGEPLEVGGGPEAPGLLVPDAAPEKAPEEPHPAHWGKIMRREAPPAPGASGAPKETKLQKLRLPFLVLFGVMAIIGFAQNAKGALLQSLNMFDVQKQLDMKGK